MINSLTRKLLNVIQIVQHHAKDDLVVTLDVEKAFDCVKWSYLFFYLKQFGLGSDIIEWIEVLYNHLTAQIITTGVRLGNFEVQRGNRHR